MSLYDFFWKIFLRRIPYEKEGNRYIAEVHSIKKPVDVTELARQMMHKGTENEYQTILSIIHQYEDLIRRNLQEGRRVNTPNCLITPRVNGVWPTAATHFNPETHQRTVSIVPSQELRHALDQVGVDIMGEKDIDAHITLITDNITGLHNDIITSGDTIKLEGKNIKVTVEDDDTGIFFIHEDGSETPVTHRLIVNEPKLVIAYTPDELSPGNYQLIIRTHYSQGGNKKCKMLKTIIYPHPITVRDGNAPIGDPV